MGKLLLSDIRYSYKQWLAIIAFTAMLGAVLSFALQLSFDAGGQPIAIKKTLEQTSGAVIFFSSVPVIPVIQSLSNLLVRKRSDTYALWMLTGVTPRQVTRSFIAEMLAFCLMGSLLGSVGSYAFQPLVRASVLPGEAGSVALGAGSIVASCITTCLIIMALVALGSVKGAIRAARVSPARMILGIEELKKKLPLFKVLVCIGSLGVLGALAASTASRTTASITPGFFLSLPLIVLVGSMALWIMPSLLRVWTALFKRFTIIAIAVQNVRYSLASSVSLELPLYIAYTLTTTLFASLPLLDQFYASRQLVGDFRIPIQASFVMVGIPVFICFAGALASILMALDSCKDNVVLLLVNGLTRRQVVVCMCCEALMHCVNALLLGLITALVAHGLLATLLGVPMALMGAPVLSRSFGSPVALDGLVGVSLSMGLPILIIGFVVLCIVYLITYLTITQKQLIAALHTTV